MRKGAATETSLALTTATVIDTPWMTAEEWIFLASTFKRVTAFSRDIDEPVQHLGEVPTSAIAQSNTVQIKPFTLSAFRMAVVRSDALFLGGGDKSLLKGGTIERAEGLRYIGVHATGYEHIPMADIQALRAAGRTMVVTSIPRYATASVAEYVVGGLLTLFRGFPSASLEYTSAASGHQFGAPQGTTLGDKRVVIIGLGSIGMAVAELFHSFGCRVEYMARRRKRRLEGSHPWLRWASQLGAADELIRVLRSAEVISLHLPDIGGDPILGSEQLAVLRSGAVVVNVSRASLIDNGALISLVRKGRIRALLDVVDIPDLESCLELIQEGRLLLTHHMAFNTNASAARKARIFTENLRRFLAGKRGAAINEVSF